jgi:hypothetical protein
MPVDPPDPSDSTKPNATPTTEEDDAPKAAPSASTTNEPTEPNGTSKKFICVKEMKYQDAQGKQGEYSGYVNEDFHPHGKGKMYYKDGSVFSGVFSEGTQVHGTTTKDDTPKAAEEEFEHQNQKPSDWPGVDEAFEKVPEEEFKHQKPADWPVVDGAFEHQAEAPSAAGHRADEAYFDEICKDASSPLDPNIETPQVSDPDDDKEDDDTTDKAEEVPLHNKKTKKKTKHTPYYVERTNNKTASLQDIPSKVKASTLDMSKKAREKKKKDTLNKRRNRKNNSE